MANKKTRAKQVNKGERERLRKLKEEARVDGLEEEETVEQQLAFSDQPSAAGNEDQVTAVEKEYDEPMMSYMGPTSFEELDMMREAQERAEEVRQVTWDVQDLVRNILHDPMIDEGEKAGKIIAVANGFEERVSQAMVDDMQKDMDVLQIEAMLAMEERSRGFIKKSVEDVIDFAKRQLSTAARKKLSDSDFALPDKKKYPIHDKSHVRNALARAAQQIQAGGEGAADAKAALPKIRAAAKKFGIDMSMEKGIIIEKDAQGDWRWVGRPSNNFIDWQNDIMSKSAHQKYVAWLDGNPEMAPVFMKWHVPGTARENPVDFWMEHEGVLIMSGKLTENEARQLLKMQKQEDLGMSVQGIGLRLNKEDSREITDYWLYEVSDLPLANAANPFTSLETITKEAGMDKLEYLTEMMGSKERAEAFLKKTGQMQQGLQEAGITSKEKETVDDSSSSASTPPLSAKDDSANSDVDALVKQLTEKLDLDGLNAFVAQAQEAMEKVPLLEAMVKEMQKSDDEKLAAALTPPAMRFAWSRENRPSQSAGTQLKKTAKAEEDDEEEDELEEQLSKSIPTAHWLSSVTNTAPVPVDEEV